MFQVVIDTNVLVAAMRSNRGASFRLLKLVGSPIWRLHVSVALALEYEAVLKRNCSAFDLSEDDVDAFVSFLCTQAGLQWIYFRWRPAAADPNDDLVLEAAIASRCDFVVTFNKRDFAGCERFGIRCVTPREFLILMEERL